MILFAGLSPCWQHVVVLDRLEKDEVNRAREAHQCAAGKVLLSARAASRLGADSLALTLLGGGLGETIKQALTDEGIRYRAVSSETPSRICSTLIDRADGTITELVESAAPITAKELDAFRAGFRAEALKASVIVLAGSLPEGSPSSLWRELVSGIDAPVVADIRGAELIELLDTRPKLVKPNRAEIETTLGRPLTTDKALFDAMHELNTRGAEWVVVSEGGKNVWASHAGRLHRFTPPKIKVVNPIGSGDSFAAGIAVGLHEQKDPIEAIRLGMAAAVDNALRLLPADIERQSVLSRLKDIAGVEV